MSDKVKSDNHIITSEVIFPDLFNVTNIEIDCDNGIIRLINHT